MYLLQLMPRSRPLELELLIQYPLLPTAKSLPFLFLLPASPTAERYFLMENCSENLKQWLPNEHPSPNIKQHLENPAHS